MFTGDDHHGMIVVSADAPLHGDVGVCVVSFATIALRRCTADPARYTVIPSAGKIEIVGPQPGETITYACDGQ